MPSHRKNPPQPIGKVIDAILKELGMSRSSKEFRVFQIWDQAIAEPVRSNARPVFISHGQLVIAVRDNVWMQELGFMKEELKKKLNHALGPGVIQELRFKIGSWEERKAEENPPPEPELELAPEQVDEARAAVAVIPDPRLREQVLRTILAAARRQGPENPEPGAGDDE